MNFKKIMFVTFLVLAILTLGVVSAAENTNDTIIDNVVCSDETSDIISVNDATDEVASKGDNDDLNSIAGIDDILTTNPKTFTDLNAKIDGNDDSEVYLDGNYTFELGTDDAFKDGVVINRAVTVFGNGFTLDGDYAARIFTVTSGSVIFKDIFFVNGKTTGSGGAINGECTAINCTFSGNSAYSGGAMWGGSAVNCTFIGNSAGFGGAMMDGSAVNCTFSGNYAGFGGAMMDGSAVNCTFIANSADNYGGAMWGGSAVNCTFSGNSATYGGAMMEGSTVNCTFNSNSADYDGGAMYGDGYTATDCRFINNTAKRNGGATYQITANNCQFTNNNATENGGAMYEGTANNCVFKDNKAGISGDNTYNTNVPKPVFSVTNYSSIYNSGNKLVFTLTTPSGLPISDANITIRVYKNNDLVGTFYALSGDGWVVSVDAGSYIAVCSVENQAYDVEPANATLTITKDSSKVTSSAVTTVYNGGKYLIVTLKDSKNRPISNVKVSINLNGVKTLTTDKNGQVKLSTNALAPKIYTAKISFDGNVNYLKSSTSVKVTVKKATPKLTAKKKTFKRKVKTKKYTITLKTNTNKVMKKVKVTLKVNKKTYTAKTNAKGKATFKIKNLKKKGTFKAKVTFKATKYYNKVTKKVKIKIK